MTPERWQEVKAVLAVALEVGPANRAAHLDHVCAHDPSLRPELERLLGAEERAGSDFLAGPAIGSDQIESPSPAAEAVWIGRRVGPYEIVEEIGAGGMGDVYRALRADDQYRSEVAIKLVRAGAGSGLIVSRFKTERQILAGLDHPNIARLLDGGTTEDGVPYFVMELVRGRPIDDYCAAHHLRIRERLKLFLDVCSAVQYAHQALIIHRDIKPTNILVTAAGVPKLLDFGIAKMLSNDGEAAAHFDPSVSMCPFLTPGYASPEQIKGEPITTASDVYSLGVVLYELLANRSPYQLATRAPHEIARAICESEPERPSTAASRPDALTPPGRAEPPPERLATRLAGDLDNIVLMALRKEAARRYGSVEQFAEDIRRHLANLPVIARKDTLTYRASKFVVRHKRSVSAAAIFAVALFAETAGALHEARVARDQATLAKQRFDDVRRLANSLIFEIHDSIRQLPGATASRQLVVQRAQEYLAGLASASESDPGVVRELAAAYGRLGDVLGNPQDANLGNTTKALESYRRRTELDEKAVALDPSNRDSRRELADGYLALGLALNRAGKLDEDRMYVQRAVQTYEQLAAAAPQDRRVQYGLAKAYERTGNVLVEANELDRARQMYEKSLPMYERLAALEPENKDYRSGVAFGHKRIAAILAMRNQLQEALAHERAALEYEESDLAANANSARARYAITFTYDDTGYILGKLGDIDAALGFYRKTLAIRSALAAADPHDTRARKGVATTYSYIGGLLEKKNDFAGALDAHTKVLEIRQSLFQDDPADHQLAVEVAGAQALLGLLYETQAFRPRLSGERQRMLCEKATAWLSKALPAILERKRLGRLIGDEQTLPDAIERALERCNHSLSLATR